MKKVRYLAVQVMLDVIEGSSLTNALENHINQLNDHRDRALLQAICYGVCRFYTRLNFILNSLLKSGLKNKDTDLQMLLFIGIYQLMAMNIPPHAAVSETVEVVSDLKKTWARGLINAILREYLRQKNSLDEKIDNNAEAYYAHSNWWINILKKAWPNDWQSILKANNEHPPFALRVNQLKLSRELYLEKLNQQGIAANKIAHTNNGLILQNPSNIEAVPGFLQAEVSVQDGAAQLAIDFLQLEPGMRVLDACAAPGGKLTHMLEAEPALAEIVAIEKDPKRVLSIHENIKRLQLGERPLKVICADASNIDKWWDGKLFDRILLDAPCSGSGVIRRHPDIKLLRKASDIPALSKEALNLLLALWPLLKPNGYFVYATCSILPQENTNVIEEFLEHTEDATEMQINLKVGIRCKTGWQIFPGMEQMDGFYYAVLKKKDFNHLISKARAEAKKVGLRNSDIENAIKKVRKETTLIIKQNKKNGSIFS